MNRWEILSYLKKQKKYVPISKIIKDTGTKQSGIYRKMDSLKRGKSVEIKYIKLKNNGYRTVKHYRARKRKR